MVPIDSAISRAKRFAAHAQKIWHVVEYKNGQGAPLYGHLHDGDALKALQRAVSTRAGMRHDEPFVAMYAVFPDGSTHRVAAP